MEKTINVLESIYNTLQDLDVKGEKSCSYIVGISNVIKQHIKELRETEINQELIK